jgi:hypothetical protein
MSMKIPCKFQEKKIGSCTTVPMSLWRLPDAPKYLADWVEDVWTSEQHRSDDRSSFSNFYTELDFRSRHCLGSFFKTPGRRGSTSGRCPAFQNIPNFSLNSERSYSGQAVLTYTCYGKNCAILEGGRKRPPGRGNLPSRRSTARVQICLDLGSL